MFLKKMSPEARFSNKLNEIQREGERFRQKFAFWFYSNIVLNLSAFHFLFSGTFLIYTKVRKNGNQKMKFYVIKISKAH